MHRSPLARAGLLAALLLAVPAAAQTGYLQPPAPIPQILDAAPTPGVSVSPDHRTLALLGRENLPSIVELSEEWLGLGGFRVNPRSNGQAAGRLNLSNSITLQDLASGARREVRLPAGTRLGYTQWSPDGKNLAFAAFAETGIELWVVDAATGAARRLLPEVVNGAVGTPFAWLPDGSGLLVRRVPEGRGAAPARTRVPNGPIIQESSGRSAPGRTYQDLLQDVTDEALFDYYFTSQLVVVQLTGDARALGRPAVYAGASVSPDGRYVLVTRWKRPYSYLVPAQRFPAEVEVLDMQGNAVKRVADIPLTDNLTASDAVAPGPRSVQWRADAPATLAWVEAQDGGDPRRQSAVRDRLFLLDAPFTGQPRVLADLDQRYGGVVWGRGDFALVTTRWFDTRREKRWVVAPDRAGQALRLLLERGSQDRYGDPGFPVTTENRAGRDVLLFTPDGRSIYLSGAGASQRGDYPFLDRMAIADGKTTRLWQAADPYYETVQAVLAADGSRVLTRRESAADAPNYFVRTLPGGQARAITTFADPAPQLAGISRQLINYERADGVKLSGTLYLPAGYDAKRDGPLPLLMWAYPTEFTDAAAAGQVRDSPNRFSRPGGISHLFVLTQGYAVLDDPAMPIIGANGQEPNDTYVDQLVASAKAAVDKVVEMGVADRDRIAVGGHSYGAFMTANLLAHSDLFRAGIARSGAYNRTLTPFGFQSEQRNYWEATDVYTRLSPFTYANRINEPILLIHGGADDNSGTFPIQSERFYAALKGLGATVRYVVLPYEAHGYRARESTGHTLAEMLNWLDRYVKNAGPRPPAAPATTTR